jgi:hypothetical protein
METNQLPPPPCPPAAAFDTAPEYLSKPASYRGAVGAKTAGIRWSTAATATHQVAASDSRPHARVVRHVRRRGQGTQLCVAVASTHSLTAVGAALARPSQAGRPPGGRAGTESSAKQTQTNTETDKQPKPVAVSRWPRRSRRGFPTSHRRSSTPSPRCAAPPSPPPGPAPTAATPTGTHSRAHDDWAGGGVRGRRRTVTACSSCADSGVGTATGASPTVLT